MTKTVILLNTTEGHRKYYIIELHRDSPNRIIVRGIWGRLGATGRTQIKYEGNGDWVAERVFQQILYEKYDHGYKLHETNNRRADTSVDVVVAILEAL